MAHTTQASHSTGHSCADDGIAALIDALPRGLFIDGEWGAASGEETIEVDNPATGEVIATIASASVADAQRAVDAAVAAQDAWALTPPHERADILQRLYQLVMDRGEDLARIITAEMGKPLAHARGEITYAAEYIRWFGALARDLGGRYIDEPGGAMRVIVRHRPVGPCYLATPWNFPLAMATRKVAPALAAGCTVVLKPSEITPLTALAFTQLCEEAGVPRGVLNVVTCADAARISDTVMADARVRKVSFTGSTAVGRTLLKEAAQNVMRSSMELGGNAPFIVLDDADLDTTVEGAMAAKMRNMGEACTAGNRYLVHASLVDEFTRRITERMKALTCGNGMDENVECGPLVSAGARDRLAGLVQSAVDEGIEVLTGGKPIEGPGYFYQPTVLRGMTRQSTIFREEIFGPVVSIMSFDTVDEAIDLANDTDYGLGSYIFTSNVERALDMSEKIHTGLMGINVGVTATAAAPFGGVKQSGIGREGGHEGLMEYLATQYIAMPRGRTL